MNALADWSKKWDLKFNISKCCVLHFGRLNPKETYKIDGRSVDSRSQEKDLGVLFSDNFKFDDHMDIIIKKANQKLGIISHVFKYKDSKVWIPLYKAFVRPYLEYNSVIWSPNTKKYDDKIEKIQMKMLRLMSCFKKLSYQEKLKETKLLSLHARRIQHQLLIMYKMKNKLIDLRFEDFFRKHTYSKTRGNIFKLMFPKSRSKAHQNFFTNACVKHWNRLMTSELNVRTCGLFKKKILDYFNRENIW